jgi:hypothetical protein
MNESGKDTVPEIVRRLFLRVYIQNVPNGFAFFFPSRRMHKTFRSLEWREAHE